MNTYQQGDRVAMRGDTQWTGTVLAVCMMFDSVQTVWDHQTDTPCWAASDQLVAAR